MKFKQILTKARGLVAAGAVCAFGSVSPSQAAIVDLGVEVVATDIFADISGVQLVNSASVYIGSWKSGFDTSAQVSPLLSDFRSGTKLIANLSDYFVVGVSTNYAALISNGNVGTYNPTIPSDTGLALRPLDFIAFSASTGTSAGALGLDYLSIRMDSVFPDTDAQSRELNIALVVPSLGADQATVLAGNLVDNSDGTGQFQTIPEPSSGILALGAACFWCVRRGFNRKI